MVCGKLELSVKLNFLPFRIGWGNHYWPVYRCTSIMCVAKVGLGHSLFESGELWGKSEIVKQPLKIHSRLILWTLVRMVCIHAMTTTTTTKIMTDK